MKRALVLSGGGSRGAYECGAWQALREAAPVEALRWELGDLRPADSLSPAAVMTIGESPLLLAARPAVAELWSTEQGAPEEPAADSEPPQETVPV